LSGEFSVGAVRGTWRPHDPRQSAPAAVGARTPRSPTACSFRADIPELGQVRIGGTFSVQASFTAALGRIQHRAAPAGDRSGGLDVDALANARSSCAGPNRPQPHHARKLDRARP